MLDVKKVGAFSHHIYAVTPRDKCTKDASATFAFTALLPLPPPPGGGGGRLRFSGVFLYASLLLKAMTSTVRFTRTAKAWLTYPTANSSATLSH
jgi:hypothetical protein